MDALDELEKRVGEKWAAAVAARTPEWPMPDIDLDLSAWQDLPPLPPGTPQFPREQWASYPNKRTTTLILCDRLLDFEQLSDEQWFQLCWLMLYGGKTRIS